ncbi:tafazzin-like isoform X2 [Mya arenaria]|nr:tafazzin-like isoform X2 [Mya arenaria]
MSVVDAWLIPTPGRETRLWRFSSTAVFAFVTGCSKLVVGYLNKPKLYNKDQFLKHVERHDKARPLITVANHYSMVDDFLIGYMCSWRRMLQAPLRRWIPGAKDVCCKTYVSSLFFQLGRVIPIVRGDGVYQKGMDFCTDIMNANGWVHVYPEGKVNTEQEYIRFKWGIGRLVAESKVCPIVLPYWHLGMEVVWPMKIPYYPRAGKKLTVLIGEPLDFTDDLNTLRNENKTQEEIRKHITDKIQDSLFKLRTKTEELHETKV